MVTTSFKFTSFILLVSFNLWIIIRIIYLDYSPKFGIVWFLFRVLV